MAPSSDKQAAPAGSEPAESSGVELLRRGLDAYNSGDLGWVYEHSAEDVEVYTAPGLVNTGGFRGKERFRVWMQEWQEAWSEMTIEIVKVEAFDDRFLVAEVWQRGIGALSGIETTMELVQLLEIADGEVARFYLYPDVENAHAALKGLRAGE